MNFPDDERIRGLQPIGMGVGTGGNSLGRILHEGELFYIFKKGTTTGNLFVWGDSWREDGHTRCWWIGSRHLIPIDDMNNIEPNCDVCKSSCKKDEPCVFFIGVWENAVV